MADYESGYDPKYRYNKHAFETKTPGIKIASLITKGVAAPIGFVSEAIHDYRDRKRMTVTADIVNSPADTDAQPQAAIQITNEDSPTAYCTANESQQSNSADPHEAVVIDADYDEADWELDEVSSASEVTAAETGQLSIDGMISEIQASGSRARKQESSHTDEPSPKKLPFPVIIPQRRPGTKSRGFVRAYAPALEDAGIDQDMFLSFIENLRRATQASPILKVIMVATTLAGAYPDPVVGAAVQAVQVAVAIAQEVQERWQTNKFLEQANRQIFMPRGLFAMLVTYKPGSTDQTEVSSETIDLGSQAVAKYGNGLLREMDAGVDVDAVGARLLVLKEKMQRLRVSSGRTLGEAQMPATCAPLIFPALEEQAMATKKDGTNEVLVKWQGKSQSAAMWMGDYFDRRAQASFAFKNPNSQLNTASTPAQFKSKFADPNNGVNMHFFTLVTGGKYKAEPLGAKRRWEKAKRKEAAARAKGQKVTSAKRFLGEDVLYLQIVNMPTKEEIAKARQVIKEKRSSNSS